MGKLFSPDFNILRVTFSVAFSFNQTQPAPHFRWTPNTFLTSPQTNNLHLWFQHLELVLNVLLHPGGGSGGESHHGNRVELPAEHVQPFVVLAKVVTPLV